MIVTENIAIRNAALEDLLCVGPSTKKIEKCSGLRFHSLFTLGRAKLRESQIEQHVLIVGKGFSLNITRYVCRLSPPKYSQYTCNEMNAKFCTNISVYL